MRAGSAEAPQSASSRHRAVDRRYGVRREKDLRHRGLAARPGCFPRNLLLLELRRLPGPAYERALSRRRRKEHALRAYAERFGPGGRPHAGGDFGKLSAGGRFDPDPRRAEALYGRKRADRAMKPNKISPPLW